MRANEVKQLLDSITPPGPGFGHAVVRRVGDGSRVMLGWADDQDAVLLLPVQKAPCPSIVLEHLRVIPSATVALRMHDANVVATEQVAVVRCGLRAPGIRLAFENVVAALCSRLEDEGELDLSLQIPGLERLFMALREEATASVVGLWAELALIVQSVDPRRAVAAWHDDPNDVFDFRESGRALDVKASRDALRRHWFGLRQWRASETVTCDVASFLVASAPDGKTVADLLDMIGERVGDDPASVSKLIDVTGRTLGRDLARATIDRFDLPAALASLRFVAMATIPHGTFDPEVLDARWRCGIDHLESSTAPTWTELGPAAMP